VAEKPARAQGLAFLGMAILIAADYLSVVLDGVGFIIVAYLTGRPLLLGSIGRTIWGIIWFNAPMLLTSLGTGRMLARWVPGRELAACLMYVILLLTWNLFPIPILDGGIEVSASL
jgi:hypothetical protein